MGCSRPATATSTSCPSTAPTTACTWSAPSPGWPSPSGRRTEPPAAASPTGAPDPRNIRRVARTAAIEHPFRTAAYSARRCCCVTNNRRETRGMAPTDNTVARTLHDLGLAAWFGGSLMGAAGVNGAAVVVKDPTQRLRVANSGWARWTPLNLAGMAAHLAGGAVLTGAALGTTAYARVLGKKLEHAGDVPVEGGTTPNPATPDEVTRAQRQLTALQWVIPALTGAVLVLSARMGEQHRPTQVSRGLLGRFFPSR